MDTGHKTDNGRVAFGPFQFEPRLGRLTRDGHKIKLQPKPAVVLCQLLRSPREVVSRDDLRKALWPEGTHVDFDLGIKVAIQKLRAALRDVFEEPTYIQTIPGGGYRFIAPTLRRQTQGSTAGAFSIQPLEVSPVWNLELMGFGW